LHQAQSFLEKSEKSSMRSLNEDPKVDNKSAPECTNKEGAMKVREADQKTKDVPIT
jgi:hypothetical protein